MKTKTKKKMKWWMWLCIGLVVIGLASIGISAMQGTGASQNVVETSQAQIKPIAYKVFTKGLVASKLSHDAVTDVSGQIEEVFVKEGDFVKVGDPILKVDDQALQEALEDLTLELGIAKASRKQLSSGSKVSGVQLTTAKLSYDQASLDYDQAIELLASGAYSQKQVDGAQAAKQAAYQAYVSAQSSADASSGNTDLVIQDMRIEAIQLKIDRLNEEISNSLVTAPISGTVTSLPFKALNLVTKSMVVATVQDMDQLELAINVSQYDVSKLELGQEVAITVDGAKGVIIEGKVSKIGQVAQSVQVGQGFETVVQVKVDVVDGKGALKPNYQAKAEIVIDASDAALVVPYEVIGTDEEGMKYVFLVKDHTLVKTLVETGIESEINVQILGDALKEGDALMINPSENYKDGDTVLVMGEGNND